MYAKELAVSDVALWEGWVANGRRREIRGTQRFEADVSEFPLRFSFHDGIISELCPAANETSWVLNLKRGILSTFQNSMRRFDVSHKAVEADVHGECETLYSLDRVSGTSLILNKTKDFSTCISRNKFHSILQTTPYVFHSAQHGVPVVRSRGSCDLWVDHNVYSRIDCSEAHIFQPFSNGSSGATTRVRQALELLQEEAEPADTSEPVDRRVPLLFDHDLTPKPTSGELRASRDLLRAMCLLHDGDVQPQFPHAFAHFLRTARLLSPSALTQLYLRAPALCRTARQHLLSALPLLGSNAAVALMRDLILRGGVDRSLAHDWLFAVAFIPSSGAILLVEPQVLAVSSVVRSYCRWNPSCADQRPVYEIMEHLLRVLRDAMSARVWTRQPLEKAVVAVKALANVGLASDSLRTTLRRCLADPGVPLELRLACIDAHRRLPCEDTRPFFLELFRNQTADPELRIAAYLQVMRCPNYNVIKTIKHTLEVEEVNQGMRSPSMRLCSQS
ncbi:Uncharacterized protein GBIM_16860 [Gryllus bimaculatus]|nr:Uncharacterized protein GBIM_16860 [Gryllus bimaculatus]